jgi:transposase
MKLPEHLRREIFILQPDTDVTGLKKIGEDVSEVLEYIPGELYVKQYIRPKYVVPVNNTDNTVITASLPGRLLEKCMAGEGYTNNCRQIRRSYATSPSIATIWQSRGKHPQPTICGWVKAVLMHLVGIYELHKQYVLACGYLHVDETTIQVLDEDKKGKTHRGYYWLYFNSEQKLVLFDYQPGRDTDGPDNVLKDFEGHLQTDGYSVYDHFDKRPGIILMGCMAHARRKFYDAKEKDRDRCEYALKMFGQLYALERKIEDEGLSKQEVLQLRQQQAVPILKTLKEWMLKEFPKLLPTSPTGKAMSYFLKRYDKLIVYTTNADLRIDNNRVENAVRPVAIGRKNYLFAGSHEAAQRAAMIYSLFATCRYHQINPYDWLKDVLERMHLYTTNNMAELLPHNWKKSQP